MATGAYNENAYENAVIEVLRSMKWEYMYGPDIERDYSDPTLPDVFEYQVRKLNKGVPDEAVNDAIRQVRGIAGGIDHAGDQYAVARLEVLDLLKRQRSCDSLFHIHALLTDPRCSGASHGS